MAIEIQIWACLPGLTEVLTSPAELSNKLTSQTVHAQTPSLERMTNKYKYTILNHFF